MHHKNKQRENLFLFTHKSHKIIDGVIFDIRSQEDDAKCNSILRWLEKVLKTKNFELFLIKFARKNINKFDVLLEKILAQFESNIHDKVRWKFWQDNKKSFEKIRRFFDRFEFVLSELGKNEGASILSPFVLKTKENCQKLNEFT